METNQPIRKGDNLRIRPEFQDAGDDKFPVIAIEDEDGGRVRIEFLQGLTFNKIEVVETRMIKKA